MQYVRSYHSPVQIHAEKRQVIAPRTKLVAFCAQKIPSKSQSRLRTLPMFFPVGYILFYSHTFYTYI